MGTAIAAIILDQLSKLLITGWLGPASEQHRLEIWEPVVRLEYARNSGAAFGLFGGQGILLSAVALVIIAGLLIAARRQAVQGPWQMVGMGLLIGGALGNLIDRLRLGYVTDFIDVGPWPTFNLADSAITIGIVLVVGLGFRENTAHKPRRTEADRDTDALD
ncbi:MAG TPA: signal peptidase II [Thermomicrobiales bacterium]|nr:signal peptidase II [Thermomicrobiales bacterium]